MNSDLEKVWKERVVSKGRYGFDIFLEDPRKHTGI
jgi:hypothetical protein